MNLVHSHRVGDGRAADLAIHKDETGQEMSICAWAFEENLVADS